MSGKPGERADAALDGWTVVHALSGAGLALLGLAWWAAAAVLVGFEALEAPLRRVRARDVGLFEYESWPNIVADVVFGLGGPILVNRRNLQRFPDFRPSTPARALARTGRPAAAS